MIYMDLKEIIQDEFYIKQAILEAKIATNFDEVPVGAILVDQSGNEILRQHNKKESTFNACAHAEILCLIEAGDKLKNWRLLNTTLYVTLEPCPMCFNALIQARVKKLVFGAYDPKGGSISLGYHFQQDKRLNHQIQCVGGIEQYECGKLLSDFFKNKRSSYSSKS